MSRDPHAQTVAQARQHVLDQWSDWRSLQEATAAIDNLITACLRRSGEPEKKDDHGAALLPADPSASPATTEALPNDREEMYEALKSIVGCKAFTCDCGIPEEVFSSIEAIIAKVEARRP